MLQTSSNRSNLKRHTRPAVTNVVNLSPKTAIFSEKALGLTTFVTTGQKATQKTPWIDDVCNQTQPSHRSTPQPHWCGGRRRTPEGLAAAPVGGGRAWPGFEATRRAEGSRRGRLAGGPPPTGTPSSPARRGKPRGGRRSSGATSNNSRKAPHRPPHGVRTNFVLSSPIFPLKFHH